MELWQNRRAIEMYLYINGIIFHYEQNKRKRFQNHC